jgi:hypothetical protein
MKEFVWNQDIMVIMVPSRTELYIRYKCLQQSEIGRKFAVRKSEQNNR